MRIFYLIVLLIMVTACEQTDKKEKVEFEGATFGFISKSKTTIATTLHSRQISLVPADGSDDKVVVGYGSQEMDIFPLDRNILAGTEYTIIDTVRYGDMQAPTEASTTLYIDPAIFSKGEYDLIVRFIRSNFKDPITSNKLVKWLDDDVLGLNEGDVYYTVYAVVYQKMAAFQKYYKAPEGTDHFTIRVDNHLSVARMHDGLEMEGYFDYTFRNDTLFYPSYEGIDEAKRMLTYKDKDGKAFSEIAKVLIEVQPQ